MIVSSKTGDILAEKLKWIFLKKVIDDMKEERSGIHVTSLVYDCLRRAYYEHIISEKVGDSEESLVSTLNEDNLIVFWTGKKLHEIPISNVVVNVPNTEEMKKLFEMTGEEFKAGDRLAHELPVGFRNSSKNWLAVGKIDEVMLVDGQIIIFDKKTTRSIPSKPYDHHIRQVKMYAVMLSETYGIVATKGAILYINVGSTSSQWEQRVKVYVFDLDNLSGVKEEIITKATVLEYAITNKKVPPAKPTWLCNVCPFFERCVKDGFGGEDGGELEVKKVGSNIFLGGGV